MNDNYLETNRKLWNAKTGIHVQSEFYNLREFKANPDSLNEIEKAALGEVRGKSLLHLQCHFGMDTLSWANKGALVTGVDFSDRAIEEARKLSDELNMPAEFIRSDIYDLKNHLTSKFDIVFTSYGTIGWLPDLDKWAEVIRLALKPGGLFYIVDFHPVLWMMDNDFKSIAYSYFNIEPIIETEQGTYADKTAPISGKSVGWNHSLAEMINALLNQGFELKVFNEFDYSCYNCFSNTIETEPGKFMIRGFEKKLPMMYELKCQLPY